jgi:ribose 5-phosphate isomerase A
MNIETLKQQAAAQALAYIDQPMILGVGTGSTVNHLIELLPKVRGKIEGTVASSMATMARLKALNFPVLDLNSVSDLSLYIDGADQINRFLQMIKGGGGALTREKIIASVADKFICIADQTKYVEQLGVGFALPIEVIPMARSYVARQLVKRGGQPIWREGMVTDNGNHILDIALLNIQEPITFDDQLNQISGVVCHGLFARRAADVLLLAQHDGVKTLNRNT